MHFRQVLLAALAAVAINGATNEPCVGSGGKPGVCITTSSCSSNGGTSIVGACPADPDGVRCCTKSPCSGGSLCKWSSDCAGSSLSNQCPGPGAFKCCTSSATGFGGYGAPSFPSVGACKAVAVNGAKKIVAAWPGRVRQIYCTRDCACSANPSSDHCCGEAVDLMCADAGGVPTMSGEQIAEWAMNNRGTLNLKYVIWGQKIWTASRDSVTDWKNWRSMEDRGDITANHWDHVHVSFN